MKNQIMNLRIHKGFTLLELLVVLAVLAILLNWGIPNIQQSIRNNTVLAQSNELISMLHFAKSEALRRNTDVIIVLEPGADGWSAFVEDPTEAVRPEGCEEGQLRCANHTGVILNIPSGATEVTYNNRGYIRSVEDAETWAPEVLYVRHSQCVGNNQRRRIDITGTGQISSCSLPCDEDVTECQ